MKDAYSFDRDQAGLDERYELHVGAYDRIMERTGLRFYRVEGDVGMMGGLGAHEYMAPCPAGENEVALAPGYAANVEVASAEPEAVALPPASDAPEPVDTPGLSTCEDVARAAAAAAWARRSSPTPSRPASRARSACSSCSCAATTASTTSSSPTRSAPRRGRPRLEQVERALGPAGYIGPVEPAGEVEILLDSAAVAAASAGGGFVTGRQPRRHPPARRRPRP